MKSFVVVLGLLLAQGSYAKEGFSVSLGLGGGLWSLSESDLSAELRKLSPPQTDYSLLTDELSDGLAVRFSLAYNIKGYASVELGITGHGWNLDDSVTLGGSGSVALVAHLHPLEFFLPDRNFDATVFLGGGYVIVGGGHDTDHSRGLDGGALECGFTGEYYFTNWFSLGAQVRFAVPFFSRWFVDWKHDVDYSLDSSPSALFTALLVTSTFHFVPW